MSRPEMVSVPVIRVDMGRPLQGGWVNTVHSYLHWMSKDASNAYLSVQKDIQTLKTEFVDHAIPNAHQTKRLNDLVMQLCLHNDAFQIHFEEYKRLQHAKVEPPAPPSDQPQAGPPVPPMIQPTPTQNKVNPAFDPNLLRYIPYAEIPQTIQPPQTFQQPGPPPQTFQQPGPPPQTFQQPGSLQPQPPSQPPYSGQPPPQYPPPYPGQPPPQYPPPYPGQPQPQYPPPYSGQSSPQANYWTHPHNVQPPPAYFHTSSQSQSQHLQHWGNPPTPSAPPLPEHDHSRKK